MQVVIRSPYKGYLDKHLWIPKSFINVEGVKNSLTFAFPDARSEYKTRYVYLYKEAEHHLLVPRHFWDVGGMPFPVVDCRPSEHARSGITSRIKLDHRLVPTPNGRELRPTGKDTQQQAVNALFQNQSGMLVLACGAGKTVAALEFITQLGVPGLIIVDNTTLLEQWKREIESLLDVPGGVGLIKGSTFDWKHGIALATYQTIANISLDAPEEFVRHWGIVAWDEGHHVSAPTFAPGAELFPCYRLLLTATPKRDDGGHILYELHVGSIVYKNLKQDLVARVAFDWTGLSPEETRANCKIRDVKGEIHLSTLGVYYGRWTEHLHYVLNRVWQAHQVGRRILVLCSSIDEAVNLCAMWHGVQNLYTDIPIPSPFDVGETLQPLELSKKELKKTEKKLADLNTKLALHTLSATARTLIEAQANEVKQLIDQARVHSKITALHRKREREYLRWLETIVTTGGLMIYDVDPEVRLGYLETKQVVFCYKKYGKEGLDNPALDTVVSTMPFSSQWTLQQVKGRIERPMAGKRAPVLVVIEHNIGPIIGMCKKLRGHLRDWPAEEGGPFTYELHNHPQVKQCQTPLF